MIAVERILSFYWKGRPSKYYCCAGLGAMSQLTSSAAMTAKGRNQPPGMSTVAKTATGITLASMLPAFYLAQKRYLKNQMRKCKEATIELLQGSDHHQEAQLLIDIDDTLFPSSPRIGGNDEKAYDILQGRVYPCVQQMVSLYKLPIILLTARPFISYQEMERIQTMLDRKDVYFWPGAVLPLTKIVFRGSKNKKTQFSEVAMDKFARAETYKQMLDDSRVLLHFIGDNGQGDIDTALEGLQKNIFDMAFIHKVREEDDLEIYPALEKYIGEEKLELFVTYPQLLRSSKYFGGHSIDCDADDKAMQRFNSILEGKHDFHQLNFHSDRAS